LLDTLKCCYDEKQAGLFVWARIPSQYASAFELCDEILEHSKVFITPGGIFGDEGNKYVRVSLCATEEKINDAIRRITVC